MASTVDVFRKVCLGRHSTNRFATGRLIPKEILADVLKSTMAAPSGFNLQPWQIIMVQDSSMKEMLAEASMLGAGNKFRVNDASAIAVFCADLQLRHRIERVVKLEIESNRKRRLRDDGYLASLPLVANILTGEGFVATGLKRAATDILSYSGISSMPDIEGVEAWSYKNVCFAAQNYMLSATSHNLATCPMEGFDSRRVRDVLKIPDRYVKIENMTSLKMSPNFALCV